MFRGAAKGLTHSISNSCSPSGLNILALLNAITVALRGSADGDLVLNVLSLLDVSLGMGVGVSWSGVRALRSSWLGTEVVWLLGVNILLLDGSRLGLLTLSEANNTASDGLTHALAESLLTAFNTWVLSHVVIITSLVDSHGAADNRVGSRKHNLSITGLVLGISGPTALKVLEITNASVHHVLVRLALLGTEWVENIADSGASVLKVSPFVNLHGVLAGTNTLELTNDGSEISSLLSESERTGRLGVADEIELASGNNGLFGLVGVSPVIVNEVNVEGLDVSGTVGGATSPSEAGSLLRSLVVVSARSLNGAIAGLRGTKSLAKVGNVA